MRVISTFTPWTKKRRVEKNSYIYKGEEEGRTGVWDGESLHIRTLPFRMLHCESLPVKGKAAEFKPWDSDERATIISAIKKIESNVAGLNPRGLLALPRVGSDKDIPYPFPLETCPEDFDWLLLFKIFQFRLMTMDLWGDSDHDTHESPATLLLEFVVQIFKRKGECHMFGFKPVPWIGHLFSFSFARAVEQVIDGKSVEAKPGQHMRTGCRTLLPHDMAKDYDASLATTIVESWTANRLRHNYAGGKRLLNLLGEAIDNLADSTTWYSKFGSQQYSAIAKPRSYRDPGAWFRQIQSNIILGP